MLRILLSSVSYAAMTFRAMMEEEMAFYSSPDYLKMQRKQRRHETLMHIFEQIRSKKQLPMFADHHRIRPMELVNADPV